MPESLPDYYQLLGLASQRATAEEIRTAYKRESLRTHPDRQVNATPAQRQQATERFQAVADAYFVLSDKARRREYDALYTARASDRSNDPGASSSSFFANFNGRPNDEERDADRVFGNVFEELLRPEVDRVLPLWSILGAGAGGVMGFIIANVPGLLLGGFAGNRIGAIRDAKGKSVAQVFMSLEGGQKAEILRALALKVLGSAL